MKLSREKYIIQKEYIRIWIDSKSEQTPISMISQITLATGCPIILVCQYIGELRGFTPELEAQMQRLMDFYHIEGIE